MNDEHVVKDEVLDRRSAKDPVHFVCIEGRLAKNPGDLALADKDGDLSGQYNVRVLIEDKTSRGDAARLLRKISNCVEKGPEEEKQEYINLTVKTVPRDRSPERSIPLVIQRIPQPVGD